ncbi:hemerythrin domain-containing protein [Phenylobacterium sp. LjRoot225]|uniref:hemerythrin domain-containing protein n=1 Tax=Phenylobacterium sp. LjRoot225 TaxID=3342285 RepID=UPI003ED16D24
MATPIPSTHGKTTTKRSTTASKSKTAAASGGKDAVALLKADHRAVEKLFSQYETARSEDRKEQIAQQLCLELRVHMQIEEEIFYPTSREFLKDEDIVNEAIVEHQSAKDLIEQIEGMEPADEMYDAKVTVLQEMIEHHVQEEEKEYFPQTQKTEMDMKAIGEQLAARKEELMDEMGDGALATH